MKTKENVGTVSILVDRDTPLDLLGLGENVEIRERFDTLLDDVSELDKRNSIPEDGDALVD